MDAAIVMEMDGSTGASRIDPRRTRRTRAINRTQELSQYVANGQISRKTNATDVIGKKKEERSFILQFATESTPIMALPLSFSFKAIKLTKATTTTDLTATKTTSFTGKAVQQIRRRLSNGDVKPPSTPPPYKTRHQF
ncbi:hypothetical protein Ae201684P_017780 [Aphanomyces euteiches]|nr:hypothetical protein Ae201684P_017780 [Aphanomyces euteiches]